VSNAPSTMRAGRFFAERQARWEAVLAHRLAPMRIRMDPDGRGTADQAVASRCVGDLELTDWDCPAMEGLVVRGKIRESAKRGVTIFAGYGGKEHFSIDGTDVTLQKGSLVVVGNDANIVFAVPGRVRKRTLVLPEAVLTAADHGRDRPACLLLEGDRPLAGLFRAYLDQLWNHAPQMNTREAEAAREALVTLAVGVIRAEDSLAGDSSVLRVLSGRLTDWITENIHKGSIHIADLAAAHNVSARTVHRAFATTGDTMTSVVRSRRLAAARDDIVHTQLTMTAIAHRCGFYDPSHFAREFRRQFGVSPASYRDSHGCC
jgi:AraC family transcriptional regulator, positive regulator of tynA and feaB